MKETIKQSTQDKTEWVEVKEAESIDQPQASGNLYIEYGALHITADAGYPIESLTALLREMCAIC